MSMDWISLFTMKGLSVLASLFVFAFGILVLAFVVLFFIDIS